jgi:hypothetical protein
MIAIGGAGSIQAPEQKTGVKMPAAIDVAFCLIEQRLMSGEQLSKEDMKFYKSYSAAQKGTNAGNAGKRQPIKTGR